VVIKIDGQELLSISKKERGIAMSARISSRDERIVTKIIDNKFHINPNNYFRIENERNGYSLVVFDQYDNKLIDIYYMNPNAIKIMGKFQFRELYFLVEEDEVTAKSRPDREPSMYRASCLLDAGLVIESGGSVIR
jgi:hypothetical protein